jgi:hypothetical protein
MVTKAIIEFILCGLAVTALMIYVTRDKTKDRERELQFYRSITGIDWRDSGNSVKED